MTGTVVEAGPELLVLRTNDSDHDHDHQEKRLWISSDTTAWYGGPAGMAAVRPGREVIVRTTADGLGADRIWVDIVRVTGTIMVAAKGFVEVDAGRHRGRVRVAIPPQALSRVLVRHPRLEPGYLLDVIGIRSSSGPLALQPGTSQPGYRAGEGGSPKTTGTVSRELRGTATWYSGEGHGAAYPALDPEGQAGGCPDAPTSCAGLPLLSHGSDLLVGNECAKRSATVTVTECGCTAALYCDRCVECGTSRRGRIVELTAKSFVDLGGELENGCFNATVTVG
ncbi:hypothetical protein HKK74_14990 [Actinomadura alba]|uniref:Uncharacterized protein n=1 Tax=Actinomadura alba TaxID=406431 RepID=A0ABR7LQE1_9ACTN|nr:hypothetical protein [Actinomadura alba]